MRARRIMALLLLAIVVGASVIGAAPKDKGKKGDVIWVDPDFPTRGVESITLLPAATYDNNLQHEKIVEAAMGQAMQGTGYRWVSPSYARELLRSRGGDSTIKALHAMVLQNARVDSVAGGRLCAMLRTDAVLSMRVERFEQIEPEFNQAGKPSTTVQVRAALVDSVGRLLWSAAGSQVAEGTYHDPQAGTIGVRTSGFSGTAPLTGQGSAPTFEETSAAMFTRWMPHFPAKPAPAPAPAKTP